MYSMCLTTFISFIQKYVPQYVIQYSEYVHTYVYGSRGKMVIQSSILPKQIKYFMVFGWQEGVVVLRGFLSDLEVGGLRAECCHLFRHWCRCEEKDYVTNSRPKGCEWMNEWVNEWWFDHLFDWRLPIKGYNIQVFVRVDLGGNGWWFI